MGETVTSAAYTDKWRIRRGGALIFADNTKLDGDIAGLLARPAIADGTHVTSATIYIAPDAEERLPAIRAPLAGTETNAAASAWKGMLVIRALGQNSQSIRTLLTQLLPLLSGNSLPRVWSS
jgi:urease accessory protein